MERIEHTIEPVYRFDSRVLILGTMPSPKSREQGFYYGHPQNRFFPALAGVFGEPVPQGVPERKEFLLRHGIALWDVLRSCVISGASDASIRAYVAKRLATLYSVPRPPTSALLPPNTCSSGSSSQAVVKRSLASIVRSAGQL